MYGPASGRQGRVSFQARGFLPGKQVLASTAAIAATVTALAAVQGPGAIILGGGLALSSTAVAMQVLSRRTAQSSMPQHRLSTHDVMHCTCILNRVLLSSAHLKGPQRIAKISIVLHTQVLADRGETGSRHGRAAFSILLFQVCAPSAV